MFNIKKNVYLSIYVYVYVCVCVCVCAKLLQSLPSLCDPVGYRPPGFSLCVILQVRILEWVAIYIYTYIYIPVHSKGDQSWVFIGRTDAKAETPILWPPHAKS